MDYSQHVRLRARTCSFVMLTVLVTMTASLLTATEASASRYRWKNDKDGDWTVTANWINEDNDPDGYPNSPEDVVTIGTLGLDNREITIPAGKTITIAGLTFTSSQYYSISGKCSGTTCGRLVFNNGPTADFGIAMLGANGHLRFAASVRLESSLLVYVGAFGLVSFYGPISQDLYARDLTKSGPGALEVRGANTYTGATRVAEGLLELRRPYGAAVEGNLDVGDGFGGPHSATVVVWETDQINSYLVNVKSDGWLEFQRSDSIQNLFMNDGTVVLKAAQKLKLGYLDMTGGSVIVDAESEVTLDGNVAAVSSVAGPAKVTGSATGTLHLSGSRSFKMNSGSEMDLDIGIQVTGGPSAAFIKDGDGYLKFSGTFANTYAGATQVLAGILFLRRTAAVAVPGVLTIGFGAREATVVLDRNDNIADTSHVVVGPRGRFDVLGAEDTIARLSLQGPFTVGGSGEPRLTVTGTLDTPGTEIVLYRGLLEVDHIVARSNSNRPTVISGEGKLVARTEGITLEVLDGPQPIDLAIDVSIQTRKTDGIFKTGAGAARLSAAFSNGHKGQTSISEGTLVVTGRQPESLVRLTKGTLTGTGHVGNVIAEGGTLAPGFERGPLGTGALDFGPATKVAIELNEKERQEYDQFTTRGTVTLRSPILSVSASVAPPSNSSFTIIDNDGVDPVVGAFAGLVEGATLTVEGVPLTISYRGGDGNDVVLSNGNPYTYYLAEGATGDFFDNDVLIANPNAVDAPVTLTFLKEGGSTVVEHRKVPARGRVTVQVDEIPGLEDASASTQVTSDDRVPLIVERTMFWDASYYGGHTANALARPQNRWIFAEGSQGFFDTYILIANANADATTATLTFLRESDTPFVATVPIAAFARKTVYAGDYPELRGRSFGVVVEATLPMIAERAMYFQRQGDRIWVGGHANTGIERPSHSWFHAEGATGSFFTTFILLSNPQNEEAKVGLRFLLDNGTVVTKEKTIPALQRLTINPAVEDPRLENAALSTIVESSVPIVSERSMYWQEGATPFGEGHNSSGVVVTSTRWGLAEGRVGGPREFVTYVLLANPSDTAAEVSVTYLRQAGAPIVKTYTVPPTSRYNIDVKSSVPELEGESFGAMIDVTNDVQIAVERSLYWNANGVLWAGGTNALATPIPVP